MSNTKCRYGCKNGKIFMESSRTLVDCPDCKNIVKALEQPKTVEGISLFDVLCIPENYRNLGVVKREVLSMGKTSVFSNTSLENVGKLLDNIVESIYNFNKVPYISAYVYGGSYADMKMYVYSVQKLAIEKGLGVVPYISANSLFGIQSVLDCKERHFELVKGLENNVRVDFENLEDIPLVEGLKFCRHTKLTYFDYINADVCFIDATSNTTEKGWVAVADLLAERARRNLPTYVIGYWSSISLNNNSTGFRFLVSEGGLARLDKLSLFEVKSKKQDIKDNIELEKNLDTGLAKSSIVAGVSLSEFMRD